jgi:hypothetical protein
MREDQQYCGGICRQRRYDNDPEKRDKKLAHMKKALPGREGAQTEP